MSDLERDFRRHFKIETMVPVCSEGVLHIEIIAKYPALNSFLCAQCEIVGEEPYGDDDVRVTTRCVACGTRRFTLGPAAPTSAAEFFQFTVRRP